MSNLHFVPLGQVDSVWPIASKYILAALKRHNHSTLTMAHVTDGVRTGALQLWVTSPGEGMSGAFVVRMEAHGQDMAARILELGGHWPTFAAHFDEFKRKIASDWGADKIIMDGRKGWGRVLNTKPVSYTYEVEL